MILNLRRKSILFITVPAFFVAVAGFLCSYIWLSSSHIGTIGNERASSVGYVSDILSSKLDDIAEDIAIIASSPGVISIQHKKINSNAWKSEAELLHYIQHSVSHSDAASSVEVLSIRIYDIDGKLVDGLGELSTTNTLDVSAFKSKGDYYISKNLSFDELSDKYNLAFVVPSFDKNSVLTGACLISVSADTILEPIIGYSKLTSGSLNIIDPLGVLLFSSDNAAKRSVKFPFDVMVRMLAAKNKWLTGESLQNKHKEVLMSIAPVKNIILSKSNLSWILLQENDLSDLRYPLRNFVFRGGLIWLLPVLLGIILGRRLGRKLADPLDEIIAVTRSIADGSYDRCIYVNSGDEFEKLARAFNKMCENVFVERENAESLMRELMLSKNRLQDYSDGLERSVKERTLELEKTLQNLSESREVVLSVLEDTNETKRQLERALEDLQRKEAELIQAGKLAGIGEMAAGVAHEINNPLAGILGYTQLQLERQDLDEELRRDLRNIESEVKRCVAIIERLLDFARPKPINMIPISINEIVEKALLIVSYSITREEVLVQKNMGANLPMILGDAHSLQQVFMNMVLNAFNAIQKKGQIIIETFSGAADGHSFVCVSFSDTGIGIPKENLPRIFEPFFSTSYKTGKKGAGLGLSVSHTIITQHGGRIEVDSEPGQGTNFKIILPAILKSEE